MNDHETPSTAHAASPARTASGEHRSRLLDAMARACASQGFPATTIADLAADAKVSKRTFYEHFDSKADCFVALYESASAHTLAILQSRVDKDCDWHEQLEDALQAYFEALSANPPLIHSLFIEVLSLGPIGLAARRRQNTRIAEFIMSVARGLSPDDALGLVGAIYELVLRAIEEGRADRLPELVEPAARLVRRVASGQHG